MPMPLSSTQIRTKRLGLKPLEFSGADGGACSRVAKKSDIDLAISTKATRIGIVRARLAMAGTDGNAAC